MKREICELCEREFSVPYNEQEPFVCKKHELGNEENQTPVREMSDDHFINMMSI